MGRSLALITAVLLCLPLPAASQDARATLQNAARALGADQVKSFSYTASGVSFAPGQSATPGAAWPRFNIPTFSRSVNYETASLRDEQLRSRAEMPPRGGGVPAVGEVRQIQVVSGDFAWNVVGETAAPAPVALIERQLQLWTTPHGVIKAAMANNATVQGRTVAFAAEGITVITHETTRAFFEGALAAPATMTPDRQQAARRKVTVEGVRDKRVLTDGTRSVEIHHMAGNTHADGMLMVYLPKERLLSQADAFTPGPPNAPVPAIINPLSVNLADNIARLKLGVDRLLPLHGRIVPLAELHRMIGRSN